MVKTTYTISSVELLTDITLSFMFKVVEGLMPAIPSSAYFEPAPIKHRI